MADQILVDIEILDGMVDTNVIEYSILKFEEVLYSICFLPK